MPVLMMLEKLIERSVCRYALREHGIKSVKLTPERSTGYPDRLFWFPGGRPLLIEFKTPDNGLSSKQEHVIANLRRLGYDVAVCRSVCEGIRAVEARVEAVKRSK